MRRFAVLGLALTTGMLATAAATASQQPATVAAAPAKLTVCHKTGSGTWQRSTVSSAALSARSNAGNQLRGHFRHTGDVMIAGSAACPSTTVTPAPATQPASRVTICHRTGSSTNPWRKITVSSRALVNPNSGASLILRGHMRHLGDMALVGAAACPAATTVPGNQVKLDATLRPVQGASGSGTFEATLRLRDDQLCYTLTVSGLTNVTAAHIHRVSDGSIVVPLATPASGSSSGCVSVADALLNEIAATPGSFYANVHTTAFPNGAVQGTLSR